MQILRDDHLRRVRLLLREFPVVALLGPRQVGKTTLARQLVARRAAGQRRGSTSRTPPTSPDWPIRVSSFGRSAGSWSWTRSTGSPTSSRCCASSRTALGRRLGSSCSEARPPTSCDRRPRPSRGASRSTSWTASACARSKTWTGSGCAAAFLFLTSPAPGPRAAAGSTASSGRSSPVTYRTSEAPCRRSPCAASGRCLPTGTARSGTEPSSDGRSGSSHTTVRRYLDLLTSVFVVRQLPPWHENVRKRQVRSPKVYVADSGVLHALLGLCDSRGGPVASQGRRLVGGVRDPADRPASRGVTGAMLPLVDPLRGGALTFLSWPATAVTGSRSSAPRPPGRPRRCARPSRPSASTAWTSCTPGRRATRSPPASEPSPPPASPRCCVPSGNDTPPLSLPPCTTEASAHCRYLGIGRTRFAGLFTVIT